GAQHTLLGRHFLLVFGALLLDLLAYRLCRFGVLQQRLDVHYEDVQGGGGGGRRRRLLRLDRGEEPAQRGKNEQQGKPRTSNQHQNLVPKLTWKNCVLSNGSFLSG